MPSLTGPQVKAIARDKPVVVAGIFRKSLLESYPSLTLAEVEKSIQHLLSGKKPRSDVVEILIARMFEEGVNE